MSDIQATRLLNAAIATLEGAIVPALERDDLKIALDMVLRILGMLSARFSTQEQGLEELLTRTQALLDGLADNGQSGSSGKAGVRAMETSLQKIEAECHQAEAALALIIPKLVAQAAQPGDAADKARLALQRIIDDQRSYLAQQDPDILKGISVVYRGGRIDRDQPVAQQKQLIDNASVGAYLRKRFPDTAAVGASDVKVLTGGFSKITVLFSKQAADTAPDHLVLRRDLPVPFMNKSVLDEFPLLQKLHGAGVRVAEPCWSEADAGHFGGAFIVSRCVAGSSNFMEWRTHPGATKQVSLEMAEVLAHLHTLDLGRLGYGAEAAAKSAGQAMADEINWWAELYAVWRTHSYPLIDIPLAWLQQNIPQHLFKMPARVVHGDVGFHNLMVDKGRVTALLDWEFAHFGDPGEDLTFARLFLAQISAWDDFLARYRECGGIAYSEECERFYQVWTSTRNAIGTIDAVLRFQNLPLDAVEIKYAVSGVLSPYLQLDSSALVLKNLSLPRPA